MPLLQAERGEVFAYVNDHLGMPRELIDGAGRVAWAAAHSSWGKVLKTYAPSADQGRARRVDSPFRMLGQVADDDVGLCWTRHRCFDPEVARWLSPDPLGTQGGKNLFGFIGSPTVFVDPLGLAPRHTPAGPDGEPIDTPRSTFRRDPDTGVVNHYQTFETPASPRDPRPVVLTKRYDGPGSEPHGDVPAPHIHEPEKPGGPLDNCRKPRPDEIPQGTPHPTT